MHAIQASEAGGPEVLSYDERPDPAPAEGELLLETLAAGVNRADLLQRRGFYPPPPGASDVLGLEVAGRVLRAAGPYREGELVGRPASVLWARAEQGLMYAGERFQALLDSRRTHSQSMTFRARRGRTIPRHDARAAAWSAAVQFALSGPVCHAVVSRTAESSLARARSVSSPACV